MDTKQDSQKATRQYWRTKASEVRQKSQHIRANAQVTQEIAQEL
jgi:hypothetical protein